MKSPSLNNTFSEGLAASGGLSLCSGHRSSTRLRSPPQHQHVVRPGFQYCQLRAP